MPFPAPPDLYAEVAVPAAVTQTYTYRIPPACHAFAEPGCRVVIPFGRQTLIGYVVAIHEHPPIREELQAAARPAEPNRPSLVFKDILHWIDETPIINTEILALTRWVAEYYYAPWGETLKAALPPGLDVRLETWLALTPEGGQAVQTSSVSSRTHNGRLLSWLAAIGGEVRLDDIPPDRFGKNPRQVARDLEHLGLVTLTVRTTEAPVRRKQRLVVQRLESPATPPSRPLPPAQARVLDYLREVPSALLTELVAQVAVSPAVIRQMAKKGLVALVPEAIRRNPLSHLANLPADTAPDLTPEQRQAYEAVLAAHDSRCFRPFLLHGVTGSGKTEVYLAAISAVLHRGGSALMLVPEIGLTPLLARRLIQRFGSLVALLHSSLSPGERVDEWERIRAGEARVVIGTRSAVFAPLVNLRLIVVDEEHDTSYKQSESPPHYHGRDTAILRASWLNCPIILGSATPAIETFQHTVAGKYTRLELPQRIGSRPLPEVTLVDMREVFQRHRETRFISDELQTAIAETCAQGEQVMVLLNRRGFASCWLCQPCGFVMTCPHCSVTLTYHRADHYLSCHYCGYVTPPPGRCPECHSEEGIAYVGQGTEQLEDQLRDLFPNLAIARLDRDTTRRRGMFERILHDFASGRLSVLVGTQMIAKGHDFPNVTLVGVVSVDAGLMMPDFRAAERTFQLIAQVAGRAGRGDRPGRVIVQTYRPEHYALAAGCRQDYQAFFEQELIQRRSAYYPPFCSLANLIIRHERELEGQALGEKAASLLRRAVPQIDSSDVPLLVLGPTPAPLARLRGEYRFQILLKARQRIQIRQAIRALLPALTDTERRHVLIEIDPVDLM